MTLPEKVVVLPNGKKVTMYHIAVVAEALGRTPNAIRKWEIGAIIPPTGFRDEANRRLYTQEQIDCLVKRAEECKLKTGKPMYRSPFTKRVFQDFEELNAKYAEEFSKGES